MPERDSDRIIYEKLKDYKADYNSADWEQMEGMLPQRSRTPYYAVAALLLLLLSFAGLWVGTGGLQEKDVVVQKENAVGFKDVTSPTNATAGNEQGNQSTANVSVAEPVNQPETVTAGKSSSKNEIVAPEKSMIPVVAEQVRHNKIFRKDESSKASSVDDNNNAEARQITTRTFGKGGVEEKQTIGQSHHTGADIEKSTTTKQVAITMNEEEKNYSAENTAIEAEHIVPGKPTPTGTGESNPVASATAFSEQENALINNGMVTINSDGIGSSGGHSAGNAESIVALSTIESGLVHQADGGEGFALSAKQALNGDAVPAKKLMKQIVSFVMGAGAGMSFSFTDPALLTKPGYTVDMAEELMFIKRIGITLTQGYSKRVYEGGSFPCPSGMLDCPNSYSSTISSVDFGVDIKANLLNKTKWSWYVKAGVINTVKLKELFTYNYTKIDTFVPPPTQLPPQTNFGGSNEFDEIENFGLASDVNYPPDLTVSGTKRYHMAYHAATGFDVSINPRIKMQMEAGHSFTQPTVGVEDNRLHSFGLNARVLYRLSK